MDVVGLEAGTSLTKRDFAPDELRNNVRDWPMAVQKAQNEVPTQRVNAKAPTTRASSDPMMNAVGGTTLHYWAQSWRLNPWDFRVVSETTRNTAPAASRKARRSRIGPLDWKSLSHSTTRSNTRPAYRARPATFKGAIHPRATSSRVASARVSDAAAARHRLHRSDVRGGARPGLASVSGPASINSRPYQNRSACMYHGFCNKGGCHVDAKNGPHMTTIPRAQATGRLKVVPRAHVTSIDADDKGRVSSVTYVTDGVEYIQPAKVVLLASYTYENSRLLLLSKSKAYPNSLSNNHGQVGRHYFSHAQGGGVTALFPGTSTRGTACRRRASPSTTSPTTTSITARSTSSAAATCGRIRSSPNRGGQHEHVRPHAELGIGMEGVHQGERRPRQLVEPAEDDAALRRQLPRPRSGGEGSARVSRCAASPPTSRTTSGGSARSSRTRWRSGTRRRARLRSRPARSARWARRRTRTAGRGWATTPRPTWSIAGASRTKCRTSASSARR